MINHCFVNDGFGGRSGFDKGTVIMRLRSSRGDLRKIAALILFACNDKIEECRESCNERRIEL